MKQQRKKIAALAELAAIVLDVKLADLRKIAAERNASLAALAALATPEAPQDDDISPISAAQAGLRYQQWADLKRAEINMRLSLQTAEWQVQRESATKAFGRTDALKRLGEKAKAART